ncbi:MAG: hypothetical protein KA206_01040 [Paludibacter sp.]|nr:hypothetical protein [Paludibacter sp.]
MKQTVKNLLSIAGLSNSKQNYMTAYYVQNKELNFLHVIETDYGKGNAHIACFGLPDGYKFTQSELDAHLKEWLKTNKAEKYEDRSPSDRMRDIIKFDYSQLKQ